MRRPRPQRREGGFALLIALIAMAILSILVTDLHETTGTSFSAAMAERDQLKAEYLAKSGVNLTRMLIGQEKPMRQLVAPLYAMAKLGSAPPQIPVWHYANWLLEPFANFDHAREGADQAGFSLDLAEGLGKTGGTFEIQATSENSKINVNDPRAWDVNKGHAQVAQQIYSLFGGMLPSPNKYDPIFSQFDEKGRLTTRLDVASNLIDWWDADEQRTVYDPLLNTSTSSGSEDVDAYRSAKPPYTNKNAPFDTLEELRLVHGMSDDVWATFVEPSLDAPAERMVTIWGSLAVNPNEADPMVILSRICSIKELQTVPLCGDTTGQEQMKFITLVSLVRQIVGYVPFFGKSQDFVDFLTGKPGSLYERLSKMFGGSGAGSGMGAMLGLGGGGSSSGSGGQGMMFTPIQFPPNLPDLPKDLRRMFTTSGNIFTIESTGRVGHVQRRVRSVINIDSRWQPPPPNAGRLPPLGVIAYYRID
jgi:general secretion pathway protein K